MDPHEIIIGQRCGKTFSVNALVKVSKDEEFIVGEVRWNKGKLLEKIREKESTLRAEPLNITNLRELSSEALIKMNSYMDSIIRKMAKENEMYVICELAKRYIEEERDRRKLVRCSDCQRLTEVERPGGINIHICPLMVVDTQPDGFCHHGIRKIKGEKENE